MTARILIVDDMMASVRMLAAKLTSEYYEVLTAENGPDALSLVQSRRPDLVLLDVMMPGMDGIEVCRRIKEDPSTTHIPVVMVTALSDREDRVRGLEAGADDFLTKPVTDSTLFARVRSMVRMKQLLDQWRLREETSRELGLPTEDMRLTTSNGRAADVVLVEDSTIEAKGIAEALLGDEHRVTLIQSVAEAMESDAFAEAELAIVSQDMADEDPLRLCSGLRSEDATRSLPILLIGEEHDMERLVRALDLGVNDYLLRPIDRPELLARARGLVRRKRYQDTLQSSLLQNLSLAMTDSLTGLYNRRYLDSHMTALIRRALEGQRPLALFMIDVDYFKQVNDTHGHPAGDRVLQGVAKRIANSLRGFDLVVRYGGEEFVTVLPDTDLTIATRVAERLRTLIESQPMGAEGDTPGIPVTISIGVTMMAEGGEFVDNLIKRADHALYTAKKEGRNRMVVELPGS